jgi:hypothetical protein
MMPFSLSPRGPKERASAFRVFKNKHQAVSQGNISSKLKAQRKRPHPLTFQLSASSFQLKDASIYNSHATQDHGLRRRFSTAC